MHQKQEKISVGGMMILLLALLNAVVLERGIVSHPDWYKLAYIFFPLLLISIIRFHRKLL